MTPEQKVLVQATWRRIAPLSDSAAGLFYDRLFQIDPSARALFADSDMTAQREKLMKALNLAVGSLERVDEILPTLTALGRRHVGYGVNDSHYESVGTALIWTLERGLGPAWSEEVKAAWQAAYGLLAGAMRGAGALRAAG